MPIPEIDITVDGGDWPDESTLRHFVENAIVEATKTARLKWPYGAELSLLFTDDNAMATINGQWRNTPKPTNVLSFPGADIAVGQVADSIIGDLVFAFQTVMREANEQEKPFENHLTHLVIHGFLHLFGYDHLDDEAAECMEGLEVKTLDRLGIPNPYA